MKIEQGDFTLSKRVNSVRSEIMIPMLLIIRLLIVSQASHNSLTISLYKLREQSEKIVIL
jgi:hypothetical protein